MKFFIDEKRVKPKFSVSDKVAKKIAAAFNRLQNSFAKRMNKTVDNMNIERLKTTPRAYTHYAYLDLLAPDSSSCATH